MFSYESQPGGLYSVFGRLLRTSKCFVSPEAGLSANQKAAKWAQGQLEGAGKIPNI